MDDEAYDVTESLISGKADEKMIAFAGLVMTAEPGGVAQEGLLKVATFIRTDGGGYLTLTFVVDRDPDGRGCKEIQARFARAHQEALKAHLGPNFEMLMEVPLDAFTTSDRFCIEELNLYFKTLAGHERTLLEDRIMPTLGQLLDLGLEPLEWVTEAESSGTDPSPADGSLTQRLRCRFESGTLKRGRRD